VGVESWLLTSFAEVDCWAFWTLVACASNWLLSTSISMYVLMPTIMNIWSSWLHCSSHILSCSHNFLEYLPMVFSRDFHKDMANMRSWAGLIAIHAEVIISTFHTSEPRPNQWLLLTTVSPNVRELDLVQPRSKAADSTFWEFYSGLEHFRVVLTW
jgi:hypothetical protein